MDVLSVLSLFCLLLPDFEAGAALLLREACEDLSEAEDDAASSLSNMDVFMAAAAVSALGIKNVSSITYPVKSVIAII